MMTFCSVWNEMASRPCADRVLHVKGIIGENDVPDAKTLPQIRMPRGDGSCPIRAAGRGQELMMAFCSGTRWRRARE